MSPYDDNYPTCENTFASLRLYSDTILPTEMSARLGLSASESFIKGDPIGNGRGVRRFNGWFLSSEGMVDSKDTRRHIDWIIDQIRNKSSEIFALQADKVEMDISCLWVSKGQGGPVISPPQMAALSELNIEVWWDVYFDQQA